MNMSSIKFRQLIIFTVFAYSTLSAQRPIIQGKGIRWRDCLRQNMEWYKSEEAVRIADNVLLYQKNTGGWEKNIDMAVPLDQSQKEKLLNEKDGPGSTIDNSATYTQLCYLAKLYNATKTDKYKTSFLKGFDYLLEAQYTNGGWP